MTPPTNKAAKAVVPNYYINATMRYAMMCTTCRGWGFKGTEIVDGKYRVKPCPDCRPTQSPKEK